MLRLGCGWRIEMKDKDPESRQVVIQVTVKPNGELEIVVVGSECSSPFAVAESAVAFDATLSTIAQTFEFPHDKVSKIFVEPRNTVEDDSWMNFGFAIQQVHKRDPGRLRLQTAAETWNGWVLRRPAAFNLGVAQRPEPAVGVCDWVQALTR
jgi:hypothetical protein